MVTSYSALFAVLYFGETEFSDCILSIAEKISLRQKNVKCFPYMEMRKAHRECYNTFEGGDWDLLVKVDADMVFEKDLTPWLDEIYNCNKTYHAAMLIDDAYTGLTIPSLHIFKRGHEFGSFEKSRNYMYSETTDRRIENKGVVCHGKCNDPFQAFRTGYYRAMRYDIKPKPFLHQYIKYAENNFWLMAGVKAYRANPRLNKAINFDKANVYELFLNATFGNHQ